MMTNKAHIDWYKNEFTRIIEGIREEIGSDARLKEQIIRPVVLDPATRNGEPAPWEKWLQGTNEDTFFALKRLRFQANEIWASGSADQVAREKFTAAVETEYRMSLWAAREYLKSHVDQGNRVPVNHGDAVASVQISEDEDYVRICRTCRG